MRKQKCSHGEDRETCPLCGDWQNKRLREISADAVTAATMGWEEVMFLASQLLLYRATGRSPDEIKAMDVVVAEVEESREHSAQGKHALVGPYGCPVCRALSALKRKEPDHD